MSKNIRTEASYYYVVDEDDDDEENDEYTAQEYAVYKAMNLTHELRKERWL